MSVARERGVFIRTTEDENHNAIPDDLSNYKTAKHGDLVINKMKAWQGSLGIAPVDGIVSPAYFVFRTAFTVPAFAEYLLRSKPYVAKFGAASDGIRVGQWDLNMNRMRDIQVVLPSAQEQSRIVKYLAHATARIDKAIATKRRLIALLEEQRVSATNQVVRQVSGRLVPLKFALTDIKAGAWGQSPAESADPARWCVRVADFDYSAGGVRSDPRTFRAVPDAEFGRRKLRKGDLLLEGSGGGDKTPVGRVVMFNHDEPALCSNFLQRMRVAGGIEPAFLAVILRNFHATGAVRPLIKQTTGIQNLDLNAYLSTRIPIPNLVGQCETLEAIRRSVARIDSLTDRAAAEVGLLREFRTRLIADVVTGQVDVRAIAATLPDDDPAVAWGSTAAEDESVDAELDEALAGVGGAENA